MTKKLVYIANVRMPTEKAHGIQIMKTCEAFVRSGVDVELLVPDRSTPIRDSPHEYYGVKTSFVITRLPVWDTVGWFGAFGFLLESFLFTRAVRRYLRGKSYDVLYGRDEHVLARVHGKRVWESHTGSWNASARKVSAEALAIVTITQGLKDLYIANGVPAQKICIAADGIDLDDFAHPESQDDARKRLGLPDDKKIAVYIGRLDGWKGSDTLLEASKRLPPDFLVAIIGGEPQQVEELSKEHLNVKFLGYRPYRELSDNQAAADVLVLPNTGKDKISARFTSPLKLFTYMASGRPIVASDLPSIREVLDERGAFFFKPDDSNDLARAVREALEDPAAQQKAVRAREFVASYTWFARAQKILHALEHI